MFSLKSCALWPVATLGFLLLAASGDADERDPDPPMWPGRFHATMSQSRGDDMGIVDLWYDYAEGRNLNIIQTQSAEEDGPLFDNEFNNGSTYYYLPAKAKAKYCNVVEFDVGIIRPDWLKGATFLGEETHGIYDCYKWEQGDIPEAHVAFLGLGGASAGRRSSGTDSKTRRSPASERDSKGGNTRSEEGDRFITYWSEVKTDRPVRWKFFDGSTFEVIRFDEGATMEDDMFQVPAYCFSGDDGSASSPTELLYI